MPKQKQEQPTEAPEKTLQRFMDFLRAEGKATGTIEGYGRVIGELAEFFKQKPLKDLTRRDLEKFLANWSSQEDRNSPSYLNFVRIVLKAFFKWLYEKEEYPACVKWIKPKAVEREVDPRDILSPEEVYQLIRAADNERDKALVHVLYESGGRIGEVHMNAKKTHILRVGDLEFEEVGDGEPVLTAKLFIPARKRKGMTQATYLRLVDSAEAVKAWLAKHPNPKADQPLWVNLKTHLGKPMSRSAVGRLLKRLAKQCGITKPVNPHNFRHSQVTESATYLADQELKKKFGWSRGSRMLQTYSHITDRAVEEKELEARGIKQIKNKRKRILTHVKCSQCGRVYSAGRSICECGRPLDSELAKLWDQDQAETKGIQDERVKELLGRVKELETRTQRYDAYFEKFMESSPDELAEVLDIIRQRREEESDQEYKEKAEAGTAKNIKTNVRSEKAIQADLKKLEEAEEA